MTHAKEYEPSDEKFRMKIFLDNKHKIAKHNQMYAAGEVSYKLALNSYADLLHHEFVARNGFNKTGLNRYLLLK